ncbi:MAG: Holliday junction branch migration protein RuvA [Flavobacteriales bacterium]|jgi:Holliday junction DNA helicase RuvA|nr:Holliday junction branch migration protein RuvA [Flavobacteriales bacterium]MBK6753303.1 Holliday junction branch migration protein RuvA [Flavobacteriales bacterium]MBK7083899.1 Holliday junction branch migration protein RuvA [Flavobacteriales bacterium]MBK9076821.1 Holliday junction branch migration protein RuvA [Flavobacteriales bacterium]MBK9538234.1 Holliday junction branch migration protein RuvA [Flavobacteriales bacterium]
MIESLSGELLDKSPGHAVVECHGVGYWVQMVAGAYEQLPEQGRVRLHIHYAVSVDVRSGQSDHRLFGFLNTQERALFRQLITVQGVSTTVGMAILGGRKAEDLRQAIITGDEQALRGVKGIGPKLAQRIVQELAPKLSGLAFESAGLPGGSPGNTLRAEALSALVTLGLDRTKADRALQAVLKEHGEEPPALEVLIKKALKNL